MIGIGTSSISDISIGNTSVSKVYFGNETNPVWERVTEVPTTLTVNNTSGNRLSSNFNIYKIDTTPTIIKIDDVQVASSSSAGSQDISYGLDTGQHTITISGGEWYFDGYCLGVSTYDQFVKGVSFGDNYGTVIGNNSFAYCQFTNITIPDHITTIGTSSFIGCTSLSNIIIPNSVTSIGYAAFQNCTSFTSVTIPASVTNLGDQSFHKCSSLTTVIFGEGIQIPKIGSSTFSQCTSLTTITLPSSVTTIGSSAFSSCTSLTNITLPSSVTTIQTVAFASCSNLSTLTVQSVPNSIGEYAFRGCKLSSIPQNLCKCTSLGVGCFAFLNESNDLCGNYSPTQDELVRIIQTSYDSSGDYASSIFGAKTYKCTYTYHNGGDATAHNKWQSPVRIDGVQVGRMYGHYYDENYNGSAIKSYTILSRKSNAALSVTASFEPQESGAGPTNVSSSSCTPSPSTVSAGTPAELTIDIHLYTTCLVEGTLITLADGTKKPVEDITYDDLLLVYNFETGTYDYQYPTLLSAGNAEYITRITLEDDSYLDIAGVHDLYDPVRHEFVAWGRGNFDDDTAVTYHLWKEVDGKLKIMKVKSKEIIQESKRCFACMTGGTLTAFANDILVGSVLLNFAGISQEDKFYPKFQEDKKKAVTYEYFKDNIYNKANKYLTMSLNLQYLDFYYNPDTVDFDGLYAPFINSPIKPPKQGDKIVCNIAYIEGEKVTIEKHLEDEEITLPQITEEGKTKWYVVGEYKYLNAGDKLKVNFSTTIRAV